MGDSLTHNSDLQVSGAQVWSTILGTSLRTLGAHVLVRNFGKSGNTTTQMVARMSLMTYYGVPNIGIIWGGVNDPGAAIVGATTSTNLQSMIATLVAAGCTKVLVLNTPYLNYSTGGDTTATPFATYATLRTFQSAAVTAASASYPTASIVYCDVYTYMRNLIVAGTDSAGSFSWHVADGNQHLNAYGNRVVRDAVLATIQAQSGWVAALT